MLLGEEFTEKTFNFVPFHNFEHLEDPGKTETSNMFSVCKKKQQWMYKMQFFAESFHSQFLPK